MIRRILMLLTVLLAQAIPATAESREKDLDRWLDSELDGEFVVAIRSAVAQERRVWCYAGAGIVADSIPEKEYQEVMAKSAILRRALEIAGEGL